MTDHPIIFSGPMVRALLDGRKTMTRRLAWRYTNKGAAESDDLLRLPTPWQKVRPGDRLWVRENFTVVPSSAYRQSIGVQQTVRPDDTYYAAIYAEGWDRSIPKWRPSIHMPRWASRLTLVVTATKIERLQDISEADAIAEGVTPTWPDGVPITGSDMGPVCREEFRDLWKRLHGPESWDANPEVVALTFAVHKTNIDQMKEAA